MLKRRILLAIKRHPFAVGMYGVYVFVWLCICALTYYFLINGDPDTIEGIVFYWFMCACVPYLVVNIILSYQVKRFSYFYRDMANLVFIPMGLLLMVYAQHAVIQYFRMGV